MDQPKVNLLRKYPMAATFDLNPLPEGKTLLGSKVMQGPSLINQRSICLKCYVAMVRTSYTNIIADMEHIDTAGTVFCLFVFF